MAPGTDFVQNSNVMEIDADPPLESDASSSLLDWGLESRLQQMVDTKFEQLHEFIKNTIFQALEDQRLQRRQRKQQRKQQEASSGNDNKKRKRVVEEEEEEKDKGGDMIMKGTTNWAQMEHEMLVSIMRRLTWAELGSTVCYVNKSWFSALLDSLFPPSSSVLDLRRVDSFQQKSDQQRFLHYMDMVLHRRPPTQYTQLLLPTTLFADEAYFYILERLPSLKSLILPSKMMNKVYFSCVKAVLPFLTKLEEVQCVSFMVGRVATHCKFIHTLSLYGFTDRDDVHLNGVHGYIGDKLATVIANNFPALQRLTLDSCSLSVNALAIILEGHKNSLIYLNTVHCLRREEKFYMTSYGVEKAIEWDEEVVRQKAPNLQVHVQCARNNCLTCSPKYSGLINVLDLMTI